MTTFREITPQEMGGDVFSRIGKQWMLVGAGKEGDHNTMTASWGGLGVLWNKPVSTAYVRPSRYTLKFIEREDHYALCFFSEAYREALTYCGRHSGRDADKCRETGLTPRFDEAAPYFDEAELVLICRKLYQQDMSPDCFIDESLESNYNGADYHRMVIGEIVKVLQKAE